MKKRILLVAQNLDDMILDDSRILKKYFDVEILIIRSGAQMIAKLGKLIHKIREADLCFVWFATSYAFFATMFTKIFGKPTALVVVPLAPPRISRAWSVVVPLAVIEKAELVDVAYPASGVAVAR